MRLNPDFILWFWLPVIVLIQISFVLIIFFAVYLIKLTRIIKDKIDNLESFKKIISRTIIPLILVLLLAIYFFKREIL